MHTEKHDQAGEVVQVTLKAPILGGTDTGLKVMSFRIEDWWDHMTGTSWMESGGNPAALAYAMRSIIPAADAATSLPIDDNVIYGHNTASNMGHLIHVSELDPS